MATSKSIIVENGMFPMYISSWKPTGNIFQDFFGAFDHSAFVSNPNLNGTHTVFPEWTRIGPSSQVWQRFPSLEWLYPFQIEREFDGSTMSEYMRQYPIIPVGSVILYVLFIVCGKFVMRWRTPFNLRYLLAFWNFTLSVFSIMGSIRTVPRLALNLYDHGLYYSICHPPQQSYGIGACGMWAWMFCISKLPELLDTVFVVLRKKPLLFLHWYHHITVLLFCWHSFATQSSAGLYFICMNFMVHAVMYMYYCLTAFKMWPSFVPPIIITIMQLVQMAIGASVMVGIYYFKNVEGRQCNVQSYNFMAGTAMYLSYFGLFLHFMVKRYFTKEKKSKKD